MIAINTPQSYFGRNNGRSKISSPKLSNHFHEAAETETSSSTLTTYIADNESSSTTVYYEEGTMAHSTNNTNRNHEVKKNASLLSLIHPTKSAVEAVMMELHGHIATTMSLKNQAQQQARSNLKLAKARYADSHNSPTAALVAFRQHIHFQGEVTRLAILQKQWMQILLQVDVELQCSHENSTSASASATDTTDSVNPLVDVDLFGHGEAMQQVECLAQTTIMVPTKSDEELLTQLQRLVDNRSD